MRQSQDTYSSQFSGKSLRSIAGILLCLVVLGMAWLSSGYASTPEHQCSSSIARRDSSFDGKVEIGDHNIAFERFETTDSLGRTITFYLSHTSSTLKESPLIVFVQGSGGDSVFRRHDGMVTGPNIYRYILDSAAGRLLLIEKPGIKTIEEPRHFGSSEGCSKEFLEQYTLPKWAEAVSAAIAAARTLPGIDTSKTLLIGQSEGAIVAAKVAADHPFITHFASLDGNGPSQLCDLVELMRSGSFSGGKPSGNSDELARAVYDQWKKILADPDDTSRFYFGHTYKRWYSFCTDSCLAELLRFQGKIYIVHGTKDASVPVQSFDVLHTELLARGKDVQSERIDGADHGLRIRTSKGTMECMPAVVSRIVSWFAAPDSTDVIAQQDNKH